MVAGPNAAPTEPTRRRVRNDTKQAIVVDMLRRPGGTTITELVQVTGWVPHTVRGCFAMAPHGQPLAPYAMGAKPYASGGSTFIAN